MRWVPLLLSLLAVPAQAGARVLQGRDYAPAVRQALASARESVDVAMYFMIASGDPGQPVDELVAELVAAKRRGVRVRVVLENEKFRESGRAFETLRAAGVDAAYDTPGSYVHSKALVIDGRICVVGSTNWSKTALSDNHETAVLFESTAAAAAIAASLDALILDRSSPVPAGGGAAVPEALLLDKRAGRRIVAARDAHALSLYLEFLRQGGGSLPLDYAALAAEIGHPSAAGPSGVDFFEKLRRPLSRLDRKYGLLSFSGRARRVVVPAAAPAFAVPSAYWATGAATRWSTRARYAYLISLYEAQRSAKNPYWFRSQKDLASRYGLSEYTLSLGFSELERENALEVHRGGSGPGGFGDRDANVYRVNGLMSAADLARGFDSLSAKHGASVAAKARELAAELDEPKDLTVAEVFCSLIRDYGEEAVAAANRKTAAYKKGSALRHVATTVRALRLGERGE